MNYIIKDWAGNICFGGKEFKDFESAWEFLLETFPNDDQADDLQEYRVIERIKDGKYG